MIRFLCGLAFGFLLWAFDHILIEYAHIFIIALLSFAFVLCVGLIWIVAQTDKSDQSEDGQDSEAEAASKVVLRFAEEFVKSPTKACQDALPELPKMASIAVSWLLKTIALRSIFVAVTGAGGIALVVIGMQQIHRLDVQNNLLTAQNNLIELQTQPILKQAISIQNQEIDTANDWLRVQRSASITANRLASVASNWESGLTLTCSHPVLQNHADTCEQFLAVTLEDLEGSGVDPASEALFEQLMKWVMEQSTGELHRYLNFLEFSTRESLERFMSSNDIGMALRDCRMSTSFEQEVGESVYRMREWQTGLQEKLSPPSNISRPRRPTDATQPPPAKWASISALSQRFTGHGSDQTVAEFYQAVMDQHARRNTLWSEFNTKCQGIIAKTLEDIRVMEEARDRDAQQLEEVHRKAAQASRGVSP